MDLILIRKNNNDAIYKADAADAGKIRLDKVCYYFKLPRQTIRENANFICLFPQDIKNLNHVYNDHVVTDMTKDKFKYL